MTKYSGKIGFATQTETSRGIWEDVIVERPYKGYVVRNRRRWDAADDINDDFVVDNQFSVVSDAFLYSHVPDMRYLTYLGTRFKITSVEIERPRVLISVGGVYVADDSPSEATG